MVNEKRINALGGESVHKTRIRRYARVGVTDQLFGLPAVTGLA